jgi:hypothetical protein
MKFNLNLKVFFCYVILFNFFFEKIKYKINIKILMDNKPNNEMNLIFSITKATNFCAKICKTLMKEELLPVDRECLQNCGLNYASSLAYQ